MSPRRALAGAACALLLLPAGASAAPRRALLVLLPGPVPTAARQPSPDPLLRELAAQPSLAIGLLSPTQGTYSPGQALLDVTQGARVSPPGYRPRDVPALGFVARGERGEIRGWAGAVRRAASAHGNVVPGRLAASIPGGAAFAGVAGGPSLGAVVAADERGRVARVSLGGQDSLPARARALLARHRLVVVQAATRGTGGRVLRALVATRRRGELLIAVQTPPTVTQVPLLPTALAAPGTAGRGLTSATTRTAGVVAGIDLLPTVLSHLGRPVPAAVTGQPIRSAERRSAARLEALRTRYTHPAPRRVRALLALLATGGVLTVLLTAVAGRAGLRRGLRVGALAFMWAPALVLVPSAMDPASATAEVAIVAGGAFGLGLLTDVALPWPRGPVLPAAVCLAAYTVDLAVGTQLLDLSLLGPNPRSGARFFGVGNELEPALPILGFIGVAAAFGSRPRSRAMAATFAAVGAVLALVIGSGHLGADVGGVITVSAGAAAATLVARPARVTRGAVVLAATVPILAVAALAAVEWLSGASSHFSRNVLEVRGPGSLWEVVSRRYELAYHALIRGSMPLVFAAAAMVAGVGLAWRRALVAPAPGPAWHAALIGALTAGVVGAASNDSGPLLFVVAVFALGLMTAYLHGRPAGGEVASAGGRPAARGAGASAMQQSTSPSDRPEGGGRPAPVP